MVVTYSDFRRIPYGITIPHMSTGRFEGEVVFESAIESVKINEKLSGVLFNPDPSDATAGSPGRTPRKP